MTQKAIFQLMKYLEITLKKEKKISLLKLI